MDRREPVESIYEALKRLVDALGGAKVVGHRMRPYKTVADARTWLLNCLNDDRQEKLDPEQVLLLLRWGQEVGHHDAIAFVCSDAGYTNPTPVTPTDELADLARRAITAAHRAEAANRELRARMEAAHLNVEGMTP